MEQDKNNCGHCGLMGGHVGKTAVTVLALLAIFLFAKTVAEIKGWGLIGKDVAPQTTISVSGKGEVVTIPDTAKISFSVIGDKPNVADAQTKATEIGNEAVEFLKKSGVDEKDIKTTYYNISPRYDYINGAPNYYGGKRVLAGYEVTQGFEVKIKKIGDSAKILGGLGDIGVQNVSGLTFSVDKEDELKLEARAKAIVDAKTQAEKLAKDLGVSLVRIVSFNEGGNYPIYYAKAATLGMGGDMEASRAPSVPTGENTITSNVTITYEIR